MGRPPNPGRETLYPFFAAGGGRWGDPQTLAGRPCTPFLLLVAADGETPKPWQGDPAPLFCCWWRRWGDPKPWQGDPAPLFLLLVAADGETPNPGRETLYPFCAAGGGRWGDLPGKVSAGPRGMGFFVSAEPSYSRRDKLQRLQKSHPTLRFFRAAHLLLASTLSQKMPLIPYPFL